MVIISDVSLEEFPMQTTVIAFISLSQRTEQLPTIECKSNIWD